MGCDGGTIPKRHELVKTAKAPERPDARVQLYAAWFSCALSKRPLQQPVVACGLGKLYNKDAVLEYLVGRGGYGDGDKICGHITGIKDVTTLNLTPNPAYSSVNAPTQSTILGETQEKPLVSPFTCPITHREMNGKSRFSFIQTCGCVFAEQAFKEVPSTTCLKCGKAFDAKDVVPINSAKTEEIEKLRERVEVLKAERLKEAEERKARKKEKKAEKKREKAGGVGADGLTAEGGSGSGSNSDPEDGKKRKRSPQDSGDAKSKKASFNSSSASARANINMAIPDLNDRSQLPLSMRVQSDAIKSLYTRDKQPVKETYLTRGTFNRFAAGF
ncbi:Protein RTF2 [Borealophlyctis nickersoniae]|nr:Protein RTF2 [Borealophlyctis nickersoniae]